MTHRDAPAAPLSVDVKDSILEIDAQDWDSINAKQGLPWTHRFFRTVEEAEVQGASYNYLLLRAGEKLVGSAVLSTFTAHLDLLLPSRAQRICAFIRRALPSFLRPRILFCGVPISIGKHTLTIADETLRDDIVAAVHATMRDVARKENISYLCFKEFPHDMAWLHHSLMPLGYFRARSIPRVILELRWADYTDYLQAMRHGYRRQVLQSLKKLGPRQYTIPVYGHGQLPTGHPRMVILETESCPADPIHELYRQVMKRTDVKLEELGREFFAAAFQILGGDISLLAIMEDDVPIGCALLAIEKPRLSFLFAGLDYTRRDSTASYFNLLNGIVMYAFQVGCHVIDLGQTTYWPKLRMGGRPEPMCFYFQARNRVIHSVLRLLNPILFPRTALAQPRVFRDDKR